MGFLRKNSGVQVSNQPAGAHTRHLKIGVVQHAKAVSSRSASKADLTERGRDAGRSVKNAAADSKHTRNTLSFRRPPRS